MTISLIAEVAWCLSIMAFIPLPVMAEGERINFSGAIVEPTCSPAAAEGVTVAGAPLSRSSDPRRLACANLGNAAATASQIYALTIVRLSSSVPDRVLRYFYTYVKASRTDAADPMLFIQTYE